MAHGQCIHFYVHGKRRKLSCINLQLKLWLNKQDKNVLNKGGVSIYLDSIICHGLRPACPIHYFTEHSELFSKAFTTISILQTGKLEMKII